MMSSSSSWANRPNHPIFCPRHKKQQITHICIEGKCTSNPILCRQCFISQINRQNHYDHEKSLITVDEAVDHLSAKIKMNAGGMDHLYRQTIGKIQNSALVSQIQKGPLIFTEIQQKVNSIKSQLEASLQILSKQFQKIILNEKMQYFQILDQYVRLYSDNMNYIRKNIQDILVFNNSMKYFINKNTLYLKLARQSCKKENWLISAKKSLQLSSRNSQNHIHISEISRIFNMAHKLKVDLWPIWKGNSSQQNKKQSEDSSNTSQIKLFIKRKLNEWVYLPQIGSIEEQIIKNNNILTGNQAAYSNNKEGDRSNKRKVGLYNF